MMTSSELSLLPLDELFEFTLYYDKVLIGYPQQENNEWFIIKKNSSDETKYKILPAQIQSHRVLDRNTKQEIKNGSIKIEGKPSFKTMIIIGAGASFDYSFNEDIPKPPLAKDLFNNIHSNLITQYPGVENLCSQILLNKDIEQYFQRQWDKIINSYNPVLLSKIIDVQFYLHVLFQQFSSNPEFRTNNYISFFQSLRDDLINKGDNEKALIVSFNYDTILEQSLSKAFNYSFETLDDYIAFQRKKFILIKPHGSWNWVRPFKSEFIESLQLPINKYHPMNRITYERQISLGTIISNLSNSPKVINFSEDKYYYPYLLIPYKNKDAFVMPEAHNHLLDHFAEDVENIIIIGWKGMEERFKEKLRQKLAHKEITVLLVTAKDKTCELELKDYLPNAIFKEFAPMENSKGTFTELNNFIQEYPERIFK